MIFTFDDFFNINEEYKEIDELVGIVKYIFSLIEKDIDNFYNDIDKYKECIYDINSLLKGGDYYNYMGDVFKNNQINLIFHYSKKGYKGYVEYLKNTYYIYVNLNNNQFKENLKKNSTVYNGLFESLKETYKNTLLHEIKHIYDFHRTNNGILKNRKTYLYSELSKNVDDFNELPNDVILLYFKLPQEVWARFVETVSNLDFDKSFEEVLFNFKRTFYKYDILSESQKKKLLNRLYKYYKKEQRIIW